MAEDVKMINDTLRLKYIMEMSGIDGFANVEKDRHEYACEIARENNREEPNTADEFEGFRKMIDQAILNEKAK